MFLIIPCVFSDLSIRTDSHMRSEKNEKISINWNVCAIGSETYFTDEWNSSETSHVKAFTPKLF
jgi:hypothetical protein